MRKWLFALVLVSGVARAQDSVFKKYLAQNESRLEHGSAPGWDLLKQDAAQAQLIIIGESHGAADAQVVDFSALKYLNANFGVKTYVAEMDYAQANLINEYLITGDKRKLDTVFGYWIRIHAQWGNKDFYNKVVKIRALNKTLAAERRISFAGIDQVQDLDLYVKFIQRSKVKTSLSIYAQDSGFAQAADFAVRYLDTIEQNKPAFQRLLGDQFPIFEYLIRNLSYSAAGSAVNRAEGVFRNYKELYTLLHWEGQKLYGMWGFFHAHLTPFFFVGDDFISKLAASDHPTAKRILSIICFPLDSKYNVWNDVSGAWTKRPFSYDDKSLLAIDGIQDLRELTTENSMTLFRLNGLGSPFVKSGRLVNGQAPQGRLMANFKGQDYANQYVILLRNSDWLVPLK
jgi:hypothetical protein